MKFFGDSSINPREPHEDLHYQREYNAPKAWQDMVMKIDEVVLGLVQFMSDWYTSATYGLPFLETDQEHFEWTREIFDDPYFVETPEQGVSRLVRSTESKGSATTRRWSLGLRREDGFLRTPKGQTHFLRSIQQIVLAAQRTIYHGVMVQLLLCRENDRKDRNKRGYYHRPEREILNSMAEQFGALQKGPRTLDKLVEEAKRAFRIRQAPQPNHMVIPSGAQALINGMAVPQKTDFMHAGPKGPERAEQDLLGPLTFRRLPVNEGLVYSGDQHWNSNSGDPLIKEREFGVFHEMYCPFKDREHPGEGEYKSYMRDIFIYSAEVDHRVRITLRNAILYCTRFNEDGTLVELPTDIESYGYDVSAGVRRLDPFVKKDGSTVTNISEIENLYLPEWAKKHLGFKPGDADLAQSIAGLEVACAPKPHVAVRRKVHTRAAGEVKFAAETVYSDEVHQRVMARLEAETNAEDNLPKDYETAIGVLSAEDRASHARYVESKLDEGAPGISALIEGYRTAGSSATGKKTAARKTYVAGIAAMLSNPSPIPVVEPESLPVNFLAIEEFDPEFHQPVNIRTGENVGKLAEAMYDPANKEHVESCMFEHAPRHTGALEIPERSFTEPTTLEGGARPIRDQLLDMVDRNVPIPFNFVLFRPWCAWETGSALIMRGGAQTGRVPIGQQRSMFGTNAANHVHAGNFVLKWVAIVTNPDNVMVLDDVIVRRYINGMGARFYTNDDLHDLRHNSWQPADTVDRKAIVSVLLPYMEEPLEDSIDIRGYFELDMPGDLTLDELHYSAAAYMNAVFGWDQIRVEEHGGDSRDYTPNTVCFKGFSIQYNPSHKNHSNYVLNMGHMGENFGYNKVRRDLEGLASLMKEQPDHPWG